MWGYDLNAPTVPGDYWVHDFRIKMGGGLKFYSLVAPNDQSLIITRSVAQFLFFVVLGRKRAGLLLSTCIHSVVY